LWLHLCTPPMSRKDSSSPRKKKLERRGGGGGGKKKKKKKKKNLGEVRCLSFGGFKEPRFPVNEREGQGRKGEKSKWRGERGRHQRFVGHLEAKKRKEDPQRKKRKEREGTS